MTNERGLPKQPKTRRGSVQRRVPGHRRRTCAMRPALALVVLAAMTLAVAQAFGNTMSTIPVAYIGCSNSSLAVDGYHMDGGTRMWPATRAYNNGTVLNWMTSGTRYWRAFDRMNATYPAATQLWFQPCV